MIMSYHNEKTNTLFTAVGVAICKNPGKTVGLGDRISATGLLIQQKELTRAKNLNNSLETANK